MLNKNMYLSDTEENRNEKGRIRKESCNMKIEFLILSRREFHLSRLTCYREFYNKKFNIFLTRRKISYFFHEYILYHIDIICKIETPSCIHCDTSCNASVNVTRASNQTPYSVWRTRLNIYLKVMREILKYRKS